MESYDIYQNLIQQYNQLSLEEQQAILIYKSRLFNLINEITSIPNFKDLTTDEIINILPNKEQLIKEVQSFHEILNKKENITVKYSVFNLIHLDNFNILIEDIKNIYLILEQAKDKIILDNDLTVYRGISLKSKEELLEFSKGNIISTSINLDDTEPFLFSNEIAILYVFQLKKGTPLLVSPTSLVRTYKDKADYLDKKLQGKGPTLLKLINRGIDSQQEIILFKNCLSLDNKKIIEKNIENGKNMYIYYIDTEPIWEINYTKKNLS